MGHLERVLKEVVDGRPLLCVQPGGNHGDALIYRGFHKLLTDADIDYVPLTNGTKRSDTPQRFPSANGKSLIGHWKFIRHRFQSELSAVYIHGGGNFNDLYGAGVRCFKLVARYFDCPIVIGPQSCLFDETDPKALFEGVTNEVHFFCRERYSYDIISEATTSCDHVSVHLNDDTAFYLQREGLPINGLTSEHTLLAMRMDQDSANPLVEKDVSNPFRVRDISVMEDTFSEWVEAAARAEPIYTDRLHNAILGSILGKRVEMFDTGYHKNRGVYEHSLADDPKVEFHYLR